MRAVVFEKPNSIKIAAVDNPKIVEATDVIVRLTTAGICGSDLHMYEGRAPVEKGQVFGHENMGVVEEVGSAVHNVKKGDRVVLPFNIGCGSCFNCNRQYSNACLITNPQGHGGGYGYSGMGPHRGGQAELLRVPYADYNCLKLPGVPGDAFEDDFLLLSDVLPTAFHATEQAHVQVGDTVAIFGAGPVGLLAALCASIKGASEIYVIDSVPERLQLVAQIPSATAIDMRQGDPVAQILALRREHVLRVQNLDSSGGEKMPGVMCGIDAIGYEATTHDGKKPQPNQVLEDLISLVNPTGHIGIIGVYFPEDPRGVDKDEKAGKFTISLGMAWNKGISIEMGQAPVKKYNVYLRDLIIAGRIKPSFIVSHRLPLESAPDAYEKFDKRVQGFTKVLLKPQLVAA